MKTKLCFIFIIMVALVINCKDTDKELPEDIDLDLDGNVIFMRESKLEMANLTSTYVIRSYGNALAGTRPVWSHDGSKFAAIELVTSVEASDISTYFEIKIVDMKDNSIAHLRIADSKYIYLSGPLTWSPDGNTIAFVGNFGRTQIIYLNTQTGDTINTKLSLDYDSWVTALAWHPDGKNIAVSVCTRHSGFKLDNNIWMIEPYNTELKIKVTHTSGDIIEYLDWNSDGSKFLYSYSSYYSDIFIFNTDGSGNREIPNIMGLAPCWSKDGEYILYTGIGGISGSTLISGIFVTDINGSFTKLLYKNAGYCDWY
jgi:Tol biopolymer transport system component